MNTRNGTTGYSLIEVMVAISVLMVAIVAPMTVAVKSIQSSQYSLQQNTATFLAQEAVSIVETIRNDRAIEKLSNNPGAPSWNWVNDVFGACMVDTNINADPIGNDAGCNFDASDPHNLTSSDVLDCSNENCQLYFNDTVTRSRYNTEEVGLPSPFTRQVQMQSFAGDYVVVKVNVSWESNFLGQEQTVTISSTFYDIYDDLE